MRNTNMMNDERAVTMHYYAYLNDQDVVEMVMGLPSEITDSHYIPIESEDQSLVGKWYNRATGEFEDKMFYYAVLDEKDIVTEVIALPSQITDEKKILIPTYDQSLVGKWYNRATGQFGPVPIHVLAKANTGEINTLKADGTPEDRWLSAKLAEIDSKLSDLSVGVQSGYKARFRVKDNQQMTSDWTGGKELTFHFDTGIPGYFPKMIRLVDPMTSKSGFVADLYIVKNPDGTVNNAYVDKRFVGTRRTEMGSAPRLQEIDNIEMSKVVFSAGYSGGKYYDDGGSAFVENFSQTDYGEVEINHFNYTEDSLTFKMYVLDDAVGMYTTMDLYGYVY